MNQASKSLRGLLIFAAGVFIMFALNLIAAWIDLESAFYGFPKLTNEPLSTLRCPILMTTAQGSAFPSATLKNSTNRLIRPTVRIDVSSPGLWRDWKETLELDPGESERYTWEVTTQDAVFRNIVLTRITMYSAYPLPSRDSSCGILVVNFPLLNGTQLAVLAYGLGLLGLVAGTRMWRQANPSLGGSQSRAYMAMNTLGVLVTAGMVFSFLGGWLPGGILTIISLVLIFVLALNASPPGGSLG